jgi:CRISPR-associated exonuclease Cas4
VTSENLRSGIANLAEREPLPLSLVNDFLYCSRRAALKIVEGWRSANVHTARGDIVHEHSDLAGYEVVKGVTLLRALPVWSERLGLNGKCDIVEVHPHPQPLSHPMGEGGRRPGEGLTFGSLFPVEFKVGKRRKWDNDDAQLCAQGLCLEEMFNVSVPWGAVFHADSKRRREVEFTLELRALVERSVVELHRLLETQRVPPAVFKPACEECSLFDTCLPKATATAGRAERLSKLLYRAD